MSLVTPSIGLLFWMLVIFGLVFLLLAKFGFPIITKMVHKRSDYIEESLHNADAARQELNELAIKQQELIDQARKTQSQILKEATETKDRIISQARIEAQAISDQIIAHAKEEIAAEREAALRELCTEVSLLSMQISEKILCKELEKNTQQSEFINRLVDEVININT